MVNPVVINHPVCDLDMHRRINEARRETIARSIARKGKRSLLDRVLGRGPSERAVSFDASELKPAGEDVVHALKFWTDV